MSKDEKAYVIFAEPRLVFFGYMTDDEAGSDSPTVSRIRQCIYWSSGTKGALGLASLGPAPGSRVSPAVLSHRIRTRVEGVALCSPEAVAAWEAEPWG